LSFDPRAWAGIGASFAALLLAARPAAAEGPLEAKLGCEPGRAKGRALCTLELAAAPEQRLSWADALVLETPAFARALRTRVAAKELGTEGKARLTLALVLEGPGRGTLRVRARTVLCRKAGEKERCEPLTFDVEAELVAEK